MSEPYLPNPSPWVKLDDETAVNLDFIIKAVRKQDGSANEGIAFYHTGTNAASTNMPHQWVTYSNSTVADEKFELLTDLITERKSLTDLSE